MAVRPSLKARIAQKPILLAPGIFDKTRKATTQSINPNRAG